MSDEIPVVPEQPPPAARRSRLPLLAGIAVVVVVAIGLTLFLVLRDGGSASPTGGNAEVTYRLGTPQTVAGMKISELGASTFSPEDLKSAVVLKPLNGTASVGVAAVYVDADHGNRQVTFSGATGDLPDPASLVSRLKANPSDVVARLNATMTWTEVDPGPHGGKAACGTAEITIPIQIDIVTCSWQTKHTFGTIAELPKTGAAQSLSAGEVADLMRRMRNDLETPG